ncbi:FAD dependent oxidoreductase-domain-containing protein [Ilyonectria robusta]|uniref:FAD dependent oxidoreductase-domain-containing protein n=1 Tax=Ilyonectria robusta TaxID=1079257 RepID=UPI001E8EC839|nr:FAD dependent oxidoreductase-domain-containing protein [Ilyonectria robusta]KAH8670097.1 FAD dependent oxidoreductase-domain-containing protein [Ilyonectria robusta]
MVLLPAPHQDKLNEMEGLSRDTQPEAAFEGIPGNGSSAATSWQRAHLKSRPQVFSTDILVVGGGLGGVAAALGALRRGRNVFLTEEYDWLGGQLTSQAVPPDEHCWVEQFGVTRSYRALRDGIRQYYRDNYPLTDEARRRPQFNPGAGHVSKLCHEPRVAVAVIEAMLLPYIGSGKLVIKKPTKAVSCQMDEQQVVRSVEFRRLDHPDTFTVHAKYVIDATELGDLLPMTNTAYVTGFESRKDTGEPSAPEEAQPQNSQAVSICFAVDHIDGEDHTIPKPPEYDYWRNYHPDFWGAPLLGLKAPHPRTLKIVEREFTPNPNDDPALVNADQRLSGGDMNLWTFRRIAARDNFRPGAYQSDVCLVNWPMIDYFEKPIIDVPEHELEARLSAAASLSYSMLYYLQTECPRADGDGKGYPGLRLRGDITGTEHGLAMAPYIRESRRIRAITTVVEQHLSLKVRGDKGAVRYPDSVGVGMYRIDLHPSTGGDNYIDVACCPFEIPLGALIPLERPNLLAGCKNIGTTHITNGCYRLHPVEWNIGEAAGLLAAHCLDTKLSPHEVQGKKKLFEAYHKVLIQEGIETAWPDVSGY